MYFARLTHGPVELAFTDRHGGVSSAPFDSLNLAWAGDDPDALAENHRRLSDDFAPGDPVAALSQVHGNDVAYVGPEGPRTDLHGHLHARADGVVTDQPGVTLMVRGADCAMVLFADAEARVIGGCHCGRPGLVAGVVPATIERMRELGAREVTAWLGPYVCGRCYEVPEEMREDVAAAVPASRATTSWGTAVGRPRRRHQGPARRGRRRLRRPVALHPRVARPLLLPPRPPRVRPPGRAHPDGGLVTRPPRASSPPTSTPYAAASRAAARAAGRDADEITLVAVTKFFPASDVRLLAELGVTDVGENRHQEAQEKVADCQDVPVRWHFIGGLQSNKAAAVAAYADVVESVDRVKLVASAQPRRARAVPRGRRTAAGQPGPARTQSGHSGRSGADPDDLDALAAAVDEAGMLRLRGLMAVAPVGEEPAAAYARLAEIRQRFVATHPEATWLSAGMSGDLEAAVEAGATHVRLGTAVLGARPSNK